MSVLGKMFRRKKKRKYPIKRDEFGQTARQRCFEMFEDKLPFPEIAEATGVAEETVYKYHQQWLKNPRIEQQMAYYRSMLDKSAPDRDRTIELTAKLSGISKEELETLLHQPSGLKTAIEW